MPTETALTPDALARATAFFQKKKEQEEEARELRDKRAQEREDRKYAEELRKLDEIGQQFAEFATSELWTEACRLLAAVPKGGEILLGHYPVGNKHLHLRGDGFVKTFVERGRGERQVMDVANPEHLREMAEMLHHENPRTKLRAIIEPELLRIVRRIRPKDTAP